jgi:hypothetical protein
MATGFQPGRRGRAHPLTRSRRSDPLSIPIELSTEVPIEFSSLRELINLSRGDATVLGAVKGRARCARRERFHPLTAPARRSREKMSGRRARPDIRPASGGSNKGLDYADV